MLPEVEDLPEPVFGGLESSVALEGNQALLFECPPNCVYTFKFI